MKVKAVDGEDYEITSVEVDLARDMAEMFRDYNDHIEENTVRLAIYRGQIRADALRGAADRAVENRQNACIGRNEPNVICKADCMECDNLRAAIYAGEVEE